MPVNYNDELMMAYIRAAQNAQEEVEGKIALYRAFYDGEQGIETTSRQDEYLTEDVTSFGNICKRVVDIICDRLSLDIDGIAATDESGTKYAEKATEWFSTIAQNGDIDSLQKDIYRAALRDITCAVIVGWDDIEQRPTLTPNLVYDGETGLIRFHYDSDGEMILASKRWKTWNPLNLSASGRQRVTIYKPGEIERWEADPNALVGWRFLETGEINLPNPQPWVGRNGEPLGIPVIPFDAGESELEDVINIQQLINHNLGTFDIAADMHGFPILGFSGAGFPKDSDGNSVIPSFNPGTAFELGEGGSMSRVEPSDLAKMFTGGVLSWFQVLSIVKGWPMFVFDTAGGDTPSGVALKVLEGSLVSQVEDKQKRFGGAWRQVFDMCRKLHELNTGEKLDGQIELKWQQANTYDHLAESEALKNKFESGQIPIIQRWRELGYTDSDIEQMIKDKQREDQFGLADLVTGIEQ